MTLRFPANQPGQFRLVQLNPVANRLDTVRAGAAAELDAEPPHLQLAPYGVAWAQVGELKAPPADSTADTAVEELANEVHDKGWIVFSAKSTAGDWDLYLMRPDGSERRALTDTPEFNEAGPRFSPDGKRLLYYRLPKGEAVNMTYGTRELVIADADGRNPVVFGSEFPWASWGPDSTQIACLKPNGIQIVDLATRKVVRQLPRRHIAQQLVWSPDGHWFLGTANDLGPYWNIGRLKPTTGIMNPVERDGPLQLHPGLGTRLASRCLCSGHYSGTGWPRGNVVGQWRWQGEKDALRRGGASYLWRLRLARCEYCLFTRSAEDFGNESDMRGFTMAIMRPR